MDYDRKLRGLCGTCESEKACSLTVDASKPVQFCEEFHNEKPLVEKDSKKQAQAGSSGHVLNPGAPMGLCKNCDHFKDCTLPKDIGGVWHCEEYQ